MIQIQIQIQIQVLESMREGSCGGAMIGEVVGGREVREMEKRQRRRGDRRIREEAGEEEESFVICTFSQTSVENRAENDWQSGIVNCGGSRRRRREGGTWGRAQGARCQKRKVGVRAGCKERGCQDGGGCS